MRNQSGNRIQIPKIHLIRLNRRIWYERIKYFIRTNSDRSCIKDGKMGGRNGIPDKQGPAVSKEFAGREKNGERPIIAWCCLESWNLENTKYAVQCLTLYTDLIFIRTWSKAGSRSGSGSGRNGENRRGRGEEPGIVAAIRRCQAAAK